MISLNYFQKLAKRSDEQARLESLSNQSWHSTFYHSQFEGYSEHYEWDERGKKKLIRTYTGEYYRPAQTTPQRRKYAAARIALFLIGTALFITGAALPAVCNGTFYVTLFQALTVVCLAFTLMGICNLLTVRGDFTIPAFNHGPTRLKRFSLLSALTQFAAVLGSVTAAFRASPFDARSLISATLLLLAGGCLLVLNRLETSIRYDYIENPVAEPDGSVQM